MANQPIRLAVKWTEAAAASLDTIWLWNADYHSAEHAESYISFLRAHIDRLETEFKRGRPVPTRPEFRFILIKRRQRGHGHVAVYRVVRDEVEILAIFHTSQDWHQQIQNSSAS